MKKNLLLLALICLLPGFLLAQWNNSAAAAGLAIHTQNMADAKISIPDGRNGSIVFFGMLSPNNNKINCQRITADGFLAWGTAALPKKINSNAAISLVDAIPDGEGGAFVSFRKVLSSGDYQVFVQHINSDGDEVWTAGGVNITTNTSYNTYGGHMCLDDNGGVIICWEAYRKDEYNYLNDYDQVFIQRLNSSGAPQWQAGGLQVCTAAGNRENPSLVSDGAGGAIVVFLDGRNSIYYAGGTYSNLDIYAQRINNVGSRLWTSNGAAVCTATSGQVMYLRLGQRMLIPDGVGGAIIAYYDWRSEGNNGNAALYTQSLNAAGVAQWTINGIQLCTPAHSLSLKEIVTNRAQGAVVLWGESRTDGHKIYAQQVDFSGNMLWNTNGTAISPTITVYSGDVVPDGQGNYLVGWHTDLSGMVKVQKINGEAAAKQWNTDGVDVFTNAAANSLKNVELVLSDNAGAIATWWESGNIYARKLSADGVLPLVLTDFAASKVKATALLEWTSANEQNTRQFEIERSNDNQIFTPIGKLNASGNSNREITYRFTDNTPLTGNNYYRLKIMDKSGAYTYSPVLLLNFDNASNIITLQTNPVHSKALINIQAAAQEKLSIRVIDRTGKIVLFETVTVLSGSNQVSLNTLSLANGLYYIQLVSDLFKQELRMLKE